MDCDCQGLLLPQVAVQRPRGPPQQRKTCAVRCTSQVTCYLNADTNTVLCKNYTDIRHDQARGAHPSRHPSVLVLHPCLPPPPQGSRGSWPLLLTARRLAAAYGL